MLDGFEFTIKDQNLVVKLHDNILLEFVQHANTATGEVKSYTAEYKGLKFKTFPSGRIVVEGSFHKFYNDGVHNYDDFCIEKLVKVIDSLQNTFDLNPEIVHINNLEFGVNITPEFAPDTFINNLLCFKWRQFNLIEIKGPGYGKECKGSSQYFVKIYNKGSQNHLQENILRIEKKVISMCALNLKTLKLSNLNEKIYLSDLTNPALWHHCKNELIAMFNDVVFDEPIDINALTRTEQKNYNKVLIQSNWKYFSRDQRKRNKKAFSDIIDKYGKEQYRPIILKLINEKFAELIINKIATF